MDDEDKSRELAARLFGVSAQRQDAWPFRIPNFVMDAQDCRQAIEVIVNGDAKLRSVFDRRTAEYLAAIGWADGWAVKLLILTPRVLVDIMLDSLCEVRR